MRFYQHVNLGRADFMACAALSDFHARCLCVVSLCSFLSYVQYAMACSADGSDGAAVVDVDDEERLDEEFVDVIVGMQRSHSSEMVAAETSAAERGQREVSLVFQSTAGASWCMSRPHASRALRDLAEEHAPDMPSCLPRTAPRQTLRNVLEQNSHQLALSDSAMSRIVHGVLDECTGRKLWLLPLAKRVMAKDETRSAIRSLWEDMLRLSRENADGPMTSARAAAFTLGRHQMHPGRLKEWVFHPTIRAIAQEIDEARAPRDLPIVFNMLESVRHVHLQIGRGSLLRSECVVDAVLEVICSSSRPVRIREAWQSGRVCETLLCSFNPCTPQVPGSAVSSSDSLARCAWWQLVSERVFKQELDNGNCVSVTYPDRDLQLDKGRAPVLYFMAGWLLSMALSRVQRERRLGPIFCPFVNAHKHASAHEFRAKEIDARHRGLEVEVERRNEVWQGKSLIFPDGSFFDFVLTLETGYHNAFRNPVLLAAFLGDFPLKVREVVCQAAPVVAAWKRCVSHVGARDRYQAGAFDALFDFFISKWHNMRVGEYTKRLTKISRTMRAEKSAAQALRPSLKAKSAGDKPQASEQQAGRTQEQEEEANRLRVEIDDATFRRLTRNELIKHIKAVGGRGYSGRNKTDLQGMLRTLVVGIGRPRSPESLLAAHLAETTHVDGIYVDTAPEVVGQADTWADEIDVGEGFWSLPAAAGEVGEPLPFEANEDYC